MTERAKLRKEIGYAIVLLNNSEIRMRMNFRQRHNLYPINEEESYDWPSRKECYAQFKEAKRDRLYALKRIAALTAKYKKCYKT